ncbi:MAG TPA: NAD(P)H-dependent oxidoreductase [Myxococcales bacterium]
MPSSNDAIFILSALNADAQNGPAAQRAILAAACAKNLKPDVVDLPSTKVQACYGCGACGLTTPGVCAVQDPMQQVFPRIVRSRVWVLASPIRFGTHHSELKKALDRCQPLMVPLYTMRGGEMNFLPRYSPAPALLGIGLLARADPDQEAAYRALLERHGGNLAMKAGAAVLLASDSAAQAQAKVERALADLLEARR